MIHMKNISMSFRSELTRQKQTVLKNINFTINEGDCLGVLGESGSGKSTLGRIITGLLKPSEGEYFFDMSNPYKDKSSKKYLSHNISVVFQDYNTSVNPRFTVFEIIQEALVLFQKRHQKPVDSLSCVSSALNHVLNSKEHIYEKMDREITKYLEIVGLNETFRTRFPHQLSGGQLQRVCIARALAIKPKVILFDEAISSLDAHTQVQIMDLLKKIQADFNLSYIFITHDLTSVTYLCNKVMFLYKGELVEFIDVQNIAYVKNEYAKKLLNTVITL